ncbi:Septin [Backusella circina FSU 941]|nr:Septin [Backusella circina FSU 941]
MSEVTVSTPGVGISNLPNQRHKIATKKGCRYTLMVCGESGLGKTTFINTLFQTTIKQSKSPATRHAKQLDRTVEMELSKAYLEERHFSVQLSVVDTPGFGDYIDNSESWAPVVEFIDEQHEQFMLQEQQPSREGLVDVRVHACLYFIRPTGHGLKALDIEAMKRLGTRVNLIPIIAKADTLTPKDLARFKENIQHTIETRGIQVYSCTIESDDEETTQRNRSIMSASPFSVIGATERVTNASQQEVLGRSYGWGVAEVENDAHCDFNKLRNLLIRTHMIDLIDSTEAVHYENYRQQQMATRKFGEPRVKRGNTENTSNPKMREREEELRKSFTEKVRVEETRFRQWEQQLINERDRLNKDLESQHAQIKALETELDYLYQRNVVKRALQVNFEQLGPSATFVSLATVRPDNTPAVRTVVIRGFAGEHHTFQTGWESDLLVVTTNKNSRKMEEIENNNKTEINW